MTQVNKPGKMTPKSTYKAYSEGKKYPQRGFEPEEPTNLAIVSVPSNSNTNLDCYCGCLNY